MLNSKRSAKVLQLLTLTCSVLLFLFSLPQLGFCSNAGCGTSIFVMLTGWLGVMLEIGTLVNWLAGILNGEFAVFESSLGATFTWLANPLLFICWLTYYKRPRLSFFCSLLAFLFAAAFLGFNKVIVNEAGHYSLIVSYRLGYWLWLTSILVMAVVNSLLTYQRKRAVMYQSVN